MLGLGSLKETLFQWINTYTFIFIKYMVDHT